MKFIHIIAIQKSLQNKFVVATLCYCLRVCFKVTVGLSSSELVLHKMYIKGKLRSFKRIFHME